MGSVSTRQNTKYGRYGGGGAAGDTVSQGKVAREAACQGMIVRETAARE
jgi:hypothetical protein